MILVVLAVALLLPIVGLAQDVLSFEVASIKVRTEYGSPLPSSPDRYNRTNVSLRDLVIEAYGVQRYQVLGGPEWAAGTVRFDVIAKAAFVPSRPQMLQMVQRLLNERFSLRAHKETREMPVYVLSIVREDGRVGKQLNRTTVDCAAIRADRARKSGEAGSLSSPPAKGERPVCGEIQVARPGGPNGLTLTYRAEGRTMTELSSWLSQYVGRTVLDRTGLAGEFDIEVAFQPGAERAGAPVEAVSIFTAVEEQLGLKLGSSKGPVDVIVIDSVEMPTPD